MASNCVGLRQSKDDPNSTEPRKMYGLVPVKYILDVVQVLRIERALSTLNDTVAFKISGTTM